MAKEPTKKDWVYFSRVMKDEAKVVNERRELIADRAKTIKPGPRADEIIAKYERHRIPIEVNVPGDGHDESSPETAGSGATDEHDDRRSKSSGARPLAGLALSGGGIRSAAFCLGVLQALRSVTARAEPTVFDAIDYLSTVSGGGYIGTSFAASIQQTDGRFPFKSELDAPESLETQHVRNYSNYLMPMGMADIVTGFVVVARGLLINAILFLGIIFLFGWFTLSVKPSRESLKQAIWSSHGIFFWTLIAVTIFAFVQLAYAVFWLRPGRSAMLRTELSTREFWGTIFSWLVIAVLTITVLELQAYILDGIFEYAEHSRLVYLFGVFPAWWTDWMVHVGYSNWIAHILSVVPDWHGFFSWLVAAATALIAFGNKLIAVVGSSRSDRSWSGIATHWASRIALYCAAVVVPLLLWGTYIKLTYFGFQQRERGSAGDIHGHSVQTIYFGASVLLLVVSAFVTPNANSLHRYYRDRLSRAFLWKLSDLKIEDNLSRQLPPTWQRMFKSLSRGRDLDVMKLSQLKPERNDDWANSVKRAPYLIINTAINLAGSSSIGRRGRSADSFFFSPLYVGSEATGYAESLAVEEADPDLNIGTAMAISGAAASANMGANTIGPLTFSLAALNIRLGYWLPNPRRLVERVGLKARIATIAPLYFLQEALSLVDEETQNVCLTDGGHFDNLGLYELLKRRCKIIIVADAEADPTLDFNSLVRVERYARIDLGILIDLPWSELRRSYKKVTDEYANDSLDDGPTSHGPHVAIGRIDYGKEHGVLIYIKSSLTGDESDIIRDYRRLNPEFPHETTLDQFFNEDQFEVYRALGFHTTRNFFEATDKFAALKESPVDNWPKLVKDVLLQLNISEAAADKISMRQADAMI